MRVLRRSGFTIIETMLFLAVSALLSVMVLVGASVAINAQRYKDAVVTLQSDIQQQFEDVITVKNSREDAGVTGCNGARGQTDCVLLGKLLTLSSTGAVTQYAIFGREPAISFIADTEYDLLREYAPTVVESSMQAGTIEWGAQIRWPVSGEGARPEGTARDIGILVIRSPESGLTYTFTRDSASTEGLSAIITPANRHRQTLCIVPNGWTTGERMAVSIRQGASSANAVEVQSNSSLSELQC